MTEENRKAKGGIPEFKSREEEAEFWDTHDTTEFEDEFKAGEVLFDKNLIHTIIIDVDRETFIKLSHHARKKGIDLITLSHKWIIERLEQEDQLSGQDSRP